MKAYILRSGLTISPFQDPPGEARVLDRPARERQAEMLRRLGLETVPIDRVEEIRDSEFVLFPDYVYFSLSCLRGFLKAVARHRQSRRLALEDNPQTQLSLPMQELSPYPPQRQGGPPVFGFDLYYWNGPDFRPEATATLPPEVVPLKQRLVEVDPPFYVRVKEKVRIGLSRTYCMHIKHWSHIYLLNYAALTGLPFEWFPRKLPWLLWRVLTAFSLNPFKIMRRLVIKGKRCSIHPTAIVEASVLGDRVSIGAHAVVRGSYIGEGARVGEAAKVMGCVIGQKSEISWHSVVNLCVLYPHSCVGVPGVQTALLGREAYLSSMTMPLDVKFKGGYVSVRHRGRTVTTRLTTLGPCLGHRSRIGAGVMINCGREIPNDVDILPSPVSMLSKIPDGLAPGSYMIENGTLVPIDLSEGTKEKDGAAGDGCPASGPPGAA